MFHYQTQLVEVTVLLSVYLFIRHRLTTAATFGLLLARLAMLGTFAQPVQLMVSRIPQLQGNEQPLTAALVLLFWAAIVIALSRKPRDDAALPAGGGQRRPAPPFWGRRARIVWSALLLSTVALWCHSEPKLAAVAGG